MVDLKLQKDQDDAPRYGGFGDFFYFGSSRRLYWILLKEMEHVDY